MNTRTMKKPLDTKSLFIGLLLGVIFTAGIAATTESKLAQGPVGRFQVEASEHRALMVDTVTGRVWSTTNIRGMSQNEFYKSKLKTGD